MTNLVRKIVFRGGLAFVGLVCAWTFIANWLDAPARDAHRERMSQLSSEREAGKKGVVLASQVASDTTTTPAVPVIPGLLPADVYLSLEKEGMKKSGPRSSRDPSGQEWFMWDIKDSATRGNASIDLHAQVMGPTVSSVQSVQGSVTLTEEGVDEAARKFLGFLATLPYQGGSPVRAREWVHANIGPMRRHDSELSNTASTPARHFHGCLK